MINYRYIAFYDKERRNIYKNYPTIFDVISEFGEKERESIQHAAKEKFQENLMAIIGD